MLRMGRAQDAKESLMEALAIDCKNVDAFEALVGGEMMKIDEGRNVLIPFAVDAMLSDRVMIRMGIHSKPSVSSR